MRSSGRKVKPSQKVLENHSIDTQLKALQDTNISSSFATPLKPLREPAPPPDSAPQSLKAESQIESIFEAHCELSKIVPKSVITKRPLATVIADIPPLESVNFEPLDTGPERQPELQIPPNIDIDDPYALFSLFWPEDVWHTISCNTNMYAIIQRINKPPSDSSRPWFDTSIVEIKVFIGILIYMGIHNSKRTDLYWKNDIESGPIHTPQLYMSLTRFEQIKRYLHISQPLGDNVDEPKDPESAAQYPDEYMEKMWWHKVLPLADIFRDACQKYYIPGTNTTIDELMIQAYPTRI
jgi:hypothetical protein